MLKRPHLIVLTLVVLLTIIVLKLPSRTAAQLKLVVSTLFLPLFGLASTTQHLAEKSALTVLPRQELIRELDELSTTNARLRIESMELQDALRENERLRRLLHFKQSRPQWNLKPAHVVARDPANWWRSVQIDLGTLDGLSNNLPVLTPDGLVGRIAEVYSTRSRVVLLGDPNCRVSVVIPKAEDNPTTQQGIVQSAANGPLDNNLVELNFLSLNKPLKAGQKVFTSGQGGIFPAGILVGEIAEFRTVEYGLYGEAQVKLAANLSGLEEVWILVP